MLFVVHLAWSGQQASSSSDYTGWKVYGGTPDNIHYSTLRQINRANVRKLAVAWTYDSGDEFPDSEMECNPIMEHGVLYVTTPKLRLVALDAATGKLRWSFDPNQGEPVASKLRNRGVSYWEEGNDRRVFVVPGSIFTPSTPRAASRSRFWRLRARGSAGRAWPRPEAAIHLRHHPGRGLQGPAYSGQHRQRRLAGLSRRHSRLRRSHRKIRWTFHTIPHPGEYGYETWPKDAWTYIGGVNDWPE